MPGALDGLGQLTLMHGACSGHPAGKDLTPVGYILAKLGGIFVVYMLYLIGAELTNFPAAPFTPGAFGTLGTLSALGTIISFLGLHFKFPPSDRN